MVQRRLVWWLSTVVGCSILHAGIKFVLRVNRLQQDLVQVTGHSVASQVLLHVFSFLSVLCNSGWTMAEVLCCIQE
jgi:hypothetical protein